MIFSSADVMASFLVQNTLATLPLLAADWGIFVSFLPEESPDNAILVRGTEMKTDGCEQRTGLLHEHFPVQITLRSMDYPGGQAKINSIDNAILTARKVIVSIQAFTYILQSAIRRTSLVHITQETKNRRELFISNYILSIKEIS